MAYLKLVVLFVLALCLRQTSGQRGYQRPNGRGNLQRLLGNRFGGRVSGGRVSGGRVGGQVINSRPAMAAPQMAEPQMWEEPEAGAYGASAGQTGGANTAGSASGAGGGRANPTLDPRGPPPTDLPSMAQQLNGLSGGTCLAVCESIYARAAQFSPNSSAITRLIFGCPQLCGIFDNIAQIGIMGLSAFLAG